MNKSKGAETMTAKLGLRLAHHSRQTQTPARLSIKALGPPHGVDRTGNRTLADVIEGRKIVEKVTVEKSDAERLLSSKKSGGCRLEKPRKRSKCTSWILCDLWQSQNELERKFRFRRGLTARPASASAAFAIHEAGPLRVLRSRESANS
jgi:hypothetical protein